ncbi:MAG: fumarylacetoacetate hydrolase family protein [Deltaproteobacteria bacterium]|nr:fumarylacetoacetate hydrolase family protein [Deltaproteobacteria bacterium]
MKIGRFKHKDNIFYGIVEDDKVIAIDGNIYVSYKQTGKTFFLDELNFLPPVNPSKIVAVGLNYRDHVEEVKENLPESPILFIKPSTAVIGHKQKILYPNMSNRVDYEGELAIIIGKEAKQVPKEHADNFILGYTCFNDVTARDLQRKDGQWTRAKGFDTFAPVGPWIETDLDPSDLELKTYLNGEVKQFTRTSSLIFDCNYLVSFISNVMTLLPGDIIATGTTSGVGPMFSGDKVDIYIEKIGTLSNTVIKQ